MNDKSQTDISFNNTIVRLQGFIAALVDNMLCVVMLLLATAFLWLPLLVYLCIAA